MQKDSQEINVEKPRDALALLSQKIYARYGAEVLPIIEDVWHKLGLAVGAKMKEKLTDSSLSSVARYFIDSASKRSAPSVEVLEMNDEVFHMKGHKCGLNLEGKGRGLCHACMGIDRGLFVAATGSNLKIDIIQTLADNDDCCEIIIRT